MVKFHTNNATIAFFSLFLFCLVPFELKENATIALYVFFLIITINKVFQNGTVVSRCSTVIEKMLGVVLNWNIVKYEQRTLWGKDGSNRMEWMKYTYFWIKMCGIGEAMVLAMLGGCR